MLIYNKILLGIALAAPIGPVSLEMINRGLTQGFFAAFSIRLGGVIGNLLCLILACLGLTYLKDLPFVFYSLSLLGIILLFIMGYKAFTAKVDLSKTSTNSAFKSGLSWGFYLAVFNPVALAFWPGVFANSVSDINSIGFSDFFVNLFILVGVLLWGAILSFSASLGKEFFNQRTATLVTKFSGLAIIFYSFKMLYEFINKF